MYFPNLGYLENKHSHFMKLLDGNAKVINITKELNKTTDIVDNDSKYLLALYDFKVK